MKLWRVGPLTNTGISVMPSFKDVVASSKEEAIEKYKDDYLANKANLDHITYWSIVELADVVRA